MSDFHFIRPEWFFALIPLIWMLWQLNRQKLGNHGWQQIIPQHLVKHLMQGQNATTHQPFWLLAIIWMIVVVALAGPAWEKLPQPVYQTNTGKVLVMDMSQSMLATDLTPNRLTKARFKAIDLIDKIDDADMGLIAYSGDAFVISPLTADSKNLVALIPSLSPNIMPLIGSNAYAALDLADGLLKNAGYSKGEIYWITDGIDQSELQDIRELLSVSKHRVSILGVGTPQGAPIKQTSGELLKDGRGSIIIPKLNDSHLRTIAKATSGAYTRITSTAIDIETLAQQELISREAKKEQDEQLHQGDQFREFGPIMVMLILPFAAYAFRRGLVFVLVLMTSSLLLSPSAPVQAQDAKTQAALVSQTAPPLDTSSAPSWWNNMWQTQDQQAAKQFDQQNYSDAAQMFDNNQWKGSSLYKSGDYEGALKEFQQSNDANGLYNQGNAHAKMQNFDEAIKAYEQALEQNPDMEDAKKNLELIKQMQQQQQDQQNQDGENKDGENQEQQNQDQQNQEQQNQDQQGEGSEQEQNQEQQNQQGEEQDSKPREQNQQGEQDDTQASEQEQQQGDQDPQAQQKEQPEEQSVPGEEQEGEEGQEKGEQQVKPSEEQSTEEKEKMQEIQQLIRKINDDPAVLLRNKMQLEYQKRKYQNSSPPGAKSW